MKKIIALGLVYSAPALALAATGNVGSINSKKN